MGDDMIRRSILEQALELFPTHCSERQIAYPEDDPTSRDSSIQTMPLAQATRPDSPSRYRIALPLSTLLPQDPDLGLHARLHPPPSSQISPRILVDPLLRLYLRLLPLEHPETSNPQSETLPPHQSLLPEVPSAQPSSKVQGDNLDPLRSRSRLPLDIV